MKELETLVVNVRYSQNPKMLHSHIKYPVLTKVKYRATDCPPLQEDDGRETEASQATA